MNDKQHDELAQYRTFGLTLLQLMGLVSFAGIALTVIGYWLF